MSKFIKRIGTSASKFMIEMQLQKVELNLIQSCRISVILKRGDHVLETKAAVALEKGVAKFDEKIVIPATLYFDKKKNAYMKKEASISINVITPKVTRLAGVTKIDLAQYANSNTTEQDIVQNVDKCFDKNAKIYFKLRMVKVSDILPERKTRKDKEKEKKPKVNGQESGNESESKDRSESPISRIDGTENHEYSDNSSIADLSKFDGSKSQTGGFGFGKSSKASDFGLDDHSDGELDNKLRSRTVDALRVGRPSISEGGKEKKAKNFFDTPSEMTVNDSMSQGPVGNKLLELEVKVKNYQKENKELYNKIKEDNEEYMNLNQDYEDLKLKHERLQKDYDNLLNDKHMETSSSFSQGKKTDFELKVYKDKVAELEKEIKEIKQERDEANERADELQQATQDLLAKIEILKKNKNNKDLDTSNNVEEYIAKVNDLTQKLKESEKKVKELTESSPQKNGKNKSMNDDFAEIENSALKRKIEEKDSRIDELERQIGIQANEIQLMKKMASSAKNKEDNSQQFIAQLETMEKKQKGLEDTYKKRIEELTKQNTDLKRDLETAKSASSSHAFDAENELAKLSIENESLKRQVKDLNARILNVKYDNKDVDNMRARINQLEAEKDKVDAELVKAKMGWASSDMEKDEVKTKLKAKEESTKGQTERMDILEKECFRLKSRIAELMNAVMEFGDNELLDQIEAVITHGDEDGANQEQANWRRSRF